MNQQVVDLGFILNQIQDYDFSMDKFEDRLKIQKTLYLLQSFGIYLGYDFSWYLRGPYCTSLTTNALALEDIYDDIPNTKVKFRDSDKQKLFINFLKLVKGKNIDELEIMALLHYLKQIKNDDDKIKKMVENKQVRFTKDQITNMWNELKKWNLL